MDPRKETEDLEVLANDATADDSESVDDFIRQLEEKEKDLHITIDTTIIEIEQGFDDVNPSVYVTEVARAPAQEPTVAEEPVDLPFVPDVEETDDAPVVSHAIYNLEEQVDDLEEQVAALKETISRMEDERAEILKTSQRRAKDFESYKSRTQREKDDNLSSQAGNLVGKLLPALDNLDRALEFAGHLAEEKNSGFDQFFEGIVMVNRQFGEILSGMGVEPIAAVGEVFDPHLHEAVAAEATDEHPPNTVFEEMLRGYRIGDRVIRHSMVKVATALPSVVKEPDEAQAADAVAYSVEPQADERIDSQSADESPEHSDEI